MIELMLTVSIVSLLAAVALPVYSRAVRRSRTTEAPTMLASLYRGAIAYREAARSDVGGATNRQWPGPVDVPWAPPLGSCCASVGGKCAPDPALWTSATWQALTFTIDDPHFFSYWFSGWQLGDGTHPGDKFYVAASADLDCDGVLSLYRRSATVQPDGQLLGAELYVANDLE